MSRKPIQRDPSIGARMQEERIRLGLSQADFGRECNVSRTAQFNYERGERSPDANYLLDASNIGADILYIVTGRRSKEVSVSKSVDIADIAKKIGNAARIIITKELGGDHAS